MISHDSGKPYYHRFEVYANGKLIALTDFPYSDKTVKWHKSRGKEIKIIDRKAKIRS